jgi:hypothetical protein
MIGSGFGSRRRGRDRFLPTKPDSDGTIKLVPVIPKPGPRRVVAKLVKRGERLFFQVPRGYTLDPEAIGKAVAEERDSRS